MNTQNTCNLLLMSAEEVCELIGKGRTSLYYLIRDHGFPKPALTHPSKYLRAAVIEWIEEGGVNRASAD